MESDPKELHEKKSYVSRKRKRQIKLNRTRLDGVIDLILMTFTWKRGRKLSAMLKNVNNKKVYV